MFTKGQRQCLKKSWTLTPALDKSLTMSLSLTREIKSYPLFNQKRKAAFQPCSAHFRSVFGCETEACHACAVLFESCSSVDYRSTWMSPISNSPRMRLTTTMSTWVTFHWKNCVRVDVWVKILTSLLKAKCLHISGEEQIWKETLSLIWFEDRAMMGRLHKLHDLV